MGVVRPGHGHVQHLGIHAPPSIVSSRLLRRCIPQYTLGHRGRMVRLHRDLAAARARDAGVAARLSVVGASYVGVGVNDLLLAGHRLGAGLASARMAGAPTGLESLL